MHISNRTSVIVIAIIFIPLWLPLGLRLMGYYVDTSGAIVGKRIAEKGGSVQECHHILVMPWNVLSPPTADQRRTCIHTYAGLKKDPSACELLMPSSYGMSCIGVAENSQMPCNTNVKPYSVYWRDDEKENTVHVRECITEKVGRTELGEQCCEVARVAYLMNENDCSSLKKNSIVHDRCLYSLAWKLKEPSYCNEIENENARAACNVQTKAVRDDPSFCPGCVTPLESIDQLK